MADHVPVMASKLPIAVTTLSERFRRAITEDNLPLAQRIYERARASQYQSEPTATSTLQQARATSSSQPLPATDQYLEGKEKRKVLAPAKRAEWAHSKASQRPFDIRNEIDDGRESISSSARRGNGAQHYHYHHLHSHQHHSQDQRTSMSSSLSSASAQSSSSSDSSQAWRSGLGLPTPLTVRIRERERQRAYGRAPSSLALAIEHDASSEMVKWLIEMGHERPDFSRVSPSRI